MDDRRRVLGNTGSPAITGKQEAVEFLTNLHDTLEMEYCTAELRNIASRGNFVLTERVARVHGANGTVLIEIPLMGTSVVDDGRIVRYADYNADSPIGERSPAPGTDSPRHRTNGRTT